MILQTSKLLENHLNYPMVYVDMQCACQQNIDINFNKLEIKRPLTITQHTETVAISLQTNLQTAQRIDIVFIIVKLTPADR